MDRRTLLKSAAAASVAAAMPAAQAIEPTPPISAVIAPTPMKLSPYANYVWEWYVSHDGETYYQPFATKEEAIAYAQTSEYSLVAECKQQDFRLEVDGYRLLEEINESNYDLIGEGEGIECTNEQRLDLERMVERAIEAWVVKHGINITAWTFDDVRNQEDVPLPEGT